MYKRSNKCTTCAFVGSLIYLMKNCVLKIIIMKLKIVVPFKFSVSSVSFIVVVDSETVWCVTVLSKVKS
jgi:hypothetical protein